MAFLYLEVPFGPTLCVAHSGVGLIVLNQNTSQGPTILYNQLWRERYLLARIKIPTGPVLVSVLRIEHGSCFVCRLLEFLKHSSGSETLDLLRPGNKPGSRKGSRGRQALSQGAQGGRANQGRLEPPSPQSKQPNDQMTQ